MKLLAYLYSVLTCLSISQMDDVAVQGGCSAAGRCRWRWSFRPGSPAESCRSGAPERSDAGGTVCRTGENDGDDPGNNSRENWRNRLETEGARYRAWAAGSRRCASGSWTGDSRNWC